MKKDRIELPSGVRNARNIVVMMGLFTFAIAVARFALKPADWKNALVMLVGAIYMFRIVWQVNHGSGGWHDFISLSPRGNRERQ